ncbi:MAG: universal stress protein [Dehalococcoidia bacterium]
MPLDGSERAESAVPVAFDIAEPSQSDMVFVQATAVSYYVAAGPGVGYGISEERRQAEEYLAGFVNQAATLGLKAHARAAVGEPAVRIMEELQASDSAMVVMTTRGMGGLKRWALGSVADKVIRSSGHPVIVVPPAGRSYQ